VKSCWFNYYRLQDRATLERETPPECGRRLSAPTPARSTTEPPHESAKRTENEQST